MTCIAALATASGVIMGCDSLTRFSGTALDCANSKVFERGELLIGVSGTVRHNELLRFKLDLPPLPERSGNGALAREEQSALDLYMARNFSDAVHLLFKEAGVLISGEDAKHGDVYDGTALIGCRGSIYVLAGDFSCTRQKEFAACGSGMDFALAALHLTRSLEPRVRILKALETAAQFAQGVRGPFLILPDESRS